MSLFKSAPKLKYTDKVWKSNNARAIGVATEALNAIREGETAVVFFFFPKYQEEFVRFLETNNAPFHVLDSVSTADARTREKSIFVLDAFLKSTTVIDFLFSRSGTSPLKVIFFGHYPLLVPENDIMDRLTQRLGVMQIQFCLSLEDALLLSFGSERLISLMNSLGMGEQEFIEHPMVSKAILAARERISAKVENEIKEQSEAAWFDINVKLVK